MLGLCVECINLHCTVTSLVSLAQTLPRVCNNESETAHLKPLKSLSFGAPLTKDFCFGLTQTTDLQMACIEGFCQLAPPSIRPRLPFPLRPHHPNQKIIRFVLENCGPFFRRNSILPEVERYTCWRLAPLLTVIQVSQALAGLLELKGRAVFLVH